MAEIKNKPSEIFVTVTGGSITMGEVFEISDCLEKFSTADTNVTMDIKDDGSDGDEIRIEITAKGRNSSKE